MKTITSLSLSLGLALLLSGCLEHNYQITVLPRDRVEASFDMRGDRIDIDDRFDLLPDSTRWGISRAVEEKDDETTHSISGKTEFDELSELGSGMNWRKGQSDSLSYIPEFRLEKKAGLFGDTYLFSALFPSRDFDKLYGDMWSFIPPECRILEENEAQTGLSAEELAQLEEKYALGMLQWNLKRYRIRFTAVWDNLKQRGINIPDTSELALSIALAGWSDDLRRYLNSVDIPDPKTVNLEWWTDLRPLFLGHIVDLVGLENAELARDVSEALERKYQISKDVKDDVFRIDLGLPGRIGINNGKVDENGHLTWEAQGSELLNTETQALAESFDVSYWRIGLAVLLTILVIRLITRRFCRRGCKTN